MMMLDTSYHRSKMWHTLQVGSVLLVLLSAGHWCQQLPRPISLDYVGNGTDEPGGHHHHHHQMTTMLPDDEMVKEYTK